MLPGWDSHREGGVQVRKRPLEKFKLGLGRTWGPYPIMRRQAHHGQLSGATGSECAGNKYSSQLEPLAYCLRSAQTTGITDLPIHQHKQRHSLPSTVTTACSEQTEGPLNRGRFHTPQDVKLGRKHCDLLDSKTMDPGKKPLMQKQREKFFLQLFFFPSL